MNGIRGVTLDFYLTLVRHGTGQGRGVALLEYFAEQGLATERWEHQVLYDLFEFYGEHFPPEASREARDRFWVEFTRRLFARLDVRGPGREHPQDHAGAVRERLGPSSLHVFEDAVPALESLKRRGLPVGIVSNWQCGLESFCEELGLRRYVDFVISSAEVGFEKPDRRIFELALAKLGLPAESVVHVGDHPLEDYRGAREAGLNALLLVRGPGAHPEDSDTLRDLSELPDSIE